MTSPLPALVLQPLDEAEFEAWRREAIPAYAADHVQAGTWTVAECLARSREAYDTLLPTGLATSGHHFARLVAPATGLAQRGERVGFLWWAEAESAGLTGAFVYDLEIHEHARRRGYAKAALFELERIARERGLAFVGLHVFGHNAGALRLYEDVGFVPTSISMRKVLT